MVERKSNKISNLLLPTSYIVVLPIVAALILLHTKNVVVNRRLFDVNKLIVIVNI